MAQLLPGSLCVHCFFRCQRLISTRSVCNFSVPPPDIWRIIPCLIITRPTCGALGLDWCTIDLTSPVLTPLTSLYFNLSEENDRPTLLDWLNILGRMPRPSDRYVFNRAISSGSPNDILPFIHLDMLDIMLTVHGSLHECATLVEQLIMPPCCGLDLRCDHAHLGFDQRQLWTIIKKKRRSTHVREMLYIVILK